MWGRRSSSRRCTIPREADRVESAILYTRWLGFEPGGMARDLAEVYKLAKAGRCREMKAPMKRALREANEVAKQAALVRRVGR